MIDLGGACYTVVTNIDTVINHGLSTAEGLAVDWVTHHLYWVESHLDQIEVSDFDGRNRLTLILGGMESPRAVVVDPAVGQVTYCMWGTRLLVVSVAWEQTINDIVWSVSV